MQRFQWPVLRVVLIIAVVVGFVLPDDADARRRRRRRVPFQEASTLAGSFVELTAGLEEGDLSWSMNGTRSTVDASFEHLAAGAIYQLAIDGLVKTQVSGDAAGKAAVRFESPLGSGASLPLDFDPRSSQLVLRLNGQDLLVFHASIPANTSGVTAREVLRVGAAPGAPYGAGGTMVYSVDANGDRSLGVAVGALPFGLYDLVIDGSVEGSFVVNKLKRKKKKRRRRRRGRRRPRALRSLGSILLSTSDGSLRVDPLGRQIDVVGNGQTFLTTQAVAMANGVTPCTETRTLVFLPRVAGVGSAKARFRTRKDCDEDFQVEIQDVPAGIYDLRVGGVVRGQIVAAFAPAKGQIEGQIEFDTDADDPHELPLSFDPTAATIEVLQGGSVLFSGSLTGGGAGGGAGNPGICQDVEVRLPMTNTGAASLASGDARGRIRNDCRRDFRVEVEDLPAGSYTLFVAGTARGTFVVGPPLFEAELEFDTELDDPNELPLNFDPAGALIEVKQGSTTFLMVTLP